jgi:hypothetical protein
VKDAAAIAAAIYKRSSKFKRSRPVCRLYYVSTGRWQGDAALEARREKAVEYLSSTELFSDVEFVPIGAADLQKLYSESKNSISRDFIFQYRQDIPEIPGVKEAYVGFIPAKQFLPIICDANGEIVRSIFYDNVRDFQDYNDVNNGMKKTLLSDSKSRFVLTNNGITIISRNMTHTTSRFHIEDFQIVNGCQTSHVLFD